MVVDGKIQGRHKTPRVRELFRLRNRIGGSGLYVSNDSRDTCAEGLTRECRPVSPLDNGTHISCFLGAEVLFERVV